MAHVDLSETMDAHYLFSGTKMMNDLAANFLPHSKHTLLT